MMSPFKTEKEKSSTLVNDQKCGVCHQYLYRAPNCGGHDRDHADKSNERKGDDSDTSGSKDDSHQYKTPYDKFKSPFMTKYEK